MNEFEHLKALLLQDTEQQLDKIKRRMNDPSSRHKDMAAVLPQAIESAVRDEPKALQAALQAPVSDCVERALTQSPKRFAKPLLPVMSQAIRNHFADVFKSLRTFLREQQAELEKQQEIIEQLQAQLHEQGLQQEGFQENLSEQQQQNIKQQNRNNKNVQKLLQRLHTLEQQSLDMDTRARHLSQVLPEALILAQKQETRDERALSDALKAPIEKALRQSIENDTQTLANALFPIMGPAIRKSIEESIKELLKQINETVEQSMSLDGMRWRMEALRTGKPYTQVMLQHTLIYRVEQVFLIHKDSGLLMQHLYQANHQTNTDADAVSAMLTAIQDFIRDSFSDDHSELNTVEMGKYTVWLERGPYTVLACVILGVPPYEFRIQLREIQEDLHKRHSLRLEKFSGDDAEVAVIRPALEPILQEKLKIPPKNRTLNFIKKSIFWLLLFSLLLWALKGQYDKWQQHQAGKAYIQALQQSAGIVVTEYNWQKEVLHIRGLRDPLAKNPETIAQEQNFNLPIQSYWSNYQDEEFRQQRLKQSLSNYPWPTGVEAQLEQKTLYLSGITEAETLSILKKELGLFAGITQINTDALKLDDMALRFQNYIEQLQGTVGIMVLSSGQRNGQYFINGVRDPLAVDPDKLAADFQLKDIHSQWQPYQDLTPDFVLKRIMMQLLPPDSVKLSLHEGVLAITGYAPNVWIKRLQNLRFVGVEKIVSNQLKNTDDLLLQQAKQKLADFASVQIKVENEQLYLSGYVDQTERDQITRYLLDFEGFSAINQDLQDQAVLREHLISQIEENGHIYFSGGAVLLPGQNDVLDKLSQQLRLLFELNRYLERPVLLNLQGHTDQIGDIKENIELSYERATVVQQWLIQANITDEQIKLILPDYLETDKKSASDNLIRLQQRRVDFFIQR